jgi:predicted MFS family arabinose efflux permease
LLHRHSTLDASSAAVVGGSTLLLGVVTRPAGGWILRKHPSWTRTAVAASLAAGAAGTVALLAAKPAWVAAAGGLLVGVAAGMSFAPVFTGAAMMRPDAPAASVGFVNGIANLVVLLGTPLVGLSFSLASGGRVGFAVIAGLWLTALALLPTRRALGAEAP